jgi:Fe-S cluster assembly iron-binding protein IscA
MLQVTERAASALQEVLAINNAPPKRGVRLVRTDEGRLGMTIDRPREGDQVVQRNDTPVLIVDRQVAASLSGAVLDLQPAEAESAEPPALHPPPAGRVAPAGHGGSGHACGRPGRTVGAGRSQRGGNEGGGGTLGG